MNSHSTPADSNTSDFSSTPFSRRAVAVIGAGPAGLMAADRLSAAGWQVELIDTLSAPARKLLRAGIGGLNLTHMEPRPAFDQRYNEAQPDVARWLDQFGPEAVRAFAHELGIDTYVGSSQRVFPTEMKASGLLRAWLKRLDARGVRLHCNTRWVGIDPRGGLTFEQNQQTHHWQPAATVLALGGGSWPTLGSDARFVPILRDQGVEVAPFQPRNCGFEITFSRHFRERFHGQPIKPVVIRCSDIHGQMHERRGECIATSYGLEGGVIYALSSVLAKRIERDGQAGILLDLVPDFSEEQIAEKLALPRGRKSLSSHLRNKLGLAGTRAGLLYEVLPPPLPKDPNILARHIKALPLVVARARPLEEAISSAGGVCLHELDAQLMLKRLPGVFCAGEMLDWEAPTGGYLLTACLASGFCAGNGAVSWLAQQANAPARKAS